MVRIYKNLHDRNGRQAGVDCLLGAFLFGELLRLDLFTVRNQMIFYGNFATCIALLNTNRNFQFEFARTCCQVMVFILPNKTR